MAEFELPPSRVLTDAVVEAMGDDQLVAAVFLTFQLQPQFFEDFILSALCRQDGRGSPSVRRLILEERLRSMDLLVIYDQRALEIDGPLRQSIRTLPVSSESGAVHAKHALLLLQGRDKAEDSSLILLTTSANLTRSGWWTNVEVADVERLDAGKVTSLHSDLLDLIAILRRLDPSETHSTLGRIESFIRRQLSPAPGLPRLWLGRESLSQFLRSHIPTPVGRLELIAPYVDDNGAPVATLGGALLPEDLVVWFPVDGNDAGTATKNWRDGVLAIPNARFGNFNVDRKLGSQATTKRFVHAKVTRVVDARGRQSWTLVGSPNLSLRGHAGFQTFSRLSNLETAILRTSNQSTRWLAPLGTEKEPEPANCVQAEDDLGRVLLVRIRYNWASRAGDIRLADKPCRVSIGPTPRNANTAPVATIDVKCSDYWMPLPPDALEWLSRELETRNIIAAWNTALEKESVLLVEEHDFAHRPSMVARELTAADILQHWSLLSESQRAEHLDQQLSSRDPDPEAPVGESGATQHGQASMFDAFSGILHGFLVLKQRLLDAFTKERDAESTTWLLGARHDSLGTLLDKVLDDSGQDHVRKVVFALCASELLNLTEARRPSLLATQPEATARLRAQISRLESAWDSIDQGQEGASFRTWLESWWTESAERSA